MSTRSLRLLFLPPVLLSALLAPILVSAPPAHADPVIVVDMLGTPMHVGDDCTDAPNDCDLMGAISRANDDPGPAIINFDIPVEQCPDGICRSTHSLGPIHIADTVYIDGTSQPQGSGPQANVCATETAPSRMRIEISTYGHDALYVDHGGIGSVIKGLAFLAESEPGMSESAAIRVIDGSHHIECNHIGVDAVGTTEGSSRYDYGVLVSDAANAVTIGTNGDGDGDIGERNVVGYGLVGDVYIDGTDGNWVAGNYIGIGSDGSTLVRGAGLKIMNSAARNLVGTNEDGVSDEIERNYLVASTPIEFAPGGAAAPDNRFVGNTLDITPSGDPWDGGRGLQIIGLREVDSGTEIRLNTLGLAESGVEVGGDETLASVVIAENTFGGMTHTGIPFYNAGAIVLFGHGDHVVRDNLIRNSAAGALYVSDAVTIAAGSDDNCLVGNDDTVVNSTGVEVSFVNNWWGSKDGPSGVGPGLGDPVQLGVGYEPWLDSPPELCNVAPVVSDAEFTVAEDVAVGTVLGTLAASDDGANPLDFSITSGDPGGRFSVDAESGQLSVADELNYEAITQHVLAVAVSDGLTAAEATVTIVVTDVEDGPSFSDVPETHTFFTQVEWLAGVGITRGCNPPINDEFCPDDVVTRGQMAAFLHRALGDTLVTGSEPEFIDIAGSVFVNDIVWLGSVGVTKGCNPPTNDMFCPGDVVTRGQMAAFLVRAFGYTEGLGSDRFTDDDGLIFEDDIERLAEAGVTLGCNPPTNDMFCPHDAVTRAQMAAFLYRAMNS